MPFVPLTELSIPYESVECRPIEFYRFRDPYHEMEYDPWLDIWVSYKETPKGYWVVPIYDYFGTTVNPYRKKWTIKDEFILKKYSKRFLYSNMEDAMYSYYMKKINHIRYMKIKQRHLERVIKHIEKKYLPKQEKNEFFNEDDFII